MFKAEYHSLSARIKLTKDVIQTLNKAINPADSICFSGIKRSKKGDKEVIQRDLLNMTTKQTISPLFKELSSKDTLDSETWVSCTFPEKDDRNQLVCKGKSTTLMAIKVMPITLPEYELFQNPSEKLFKYKVWKEIHVLELCRAILMKPEGIPNLPMIYAWYVCQNHKVENYVNKNIIRAVEARKDTDEYGRKSAILFNELADNNLHTWLIEKMKNQVSDIKIQLDNMLFGVMVGLVALEANIGLVHFDLHLGNVLVVENMKCKENEYYKYTYSTSTGKKYTFYMPNIGTLFYIWDFSLCGLRGENNAFFIRNMIKYGKRLIDKDLFASKAEILAKNIVNKGYAEYLYSYDTFRLLQGLYRVIDEHAQKLSSSETISRGKEKKELWNRDFSNQIEDVLDELYEIREDARDDLTKRLLRNTRGAVKHTGRPLDVLLKYFKKWEKLPKGGKVLKEFKIDLLIDTVETN